MKRKSLIEYNCSGAQAAEAIGDKWLIMIIRDAFKGIGTFNGFYESIGISKNMLNLSVPVAAHPGEHFRGLVRRISSSALPFQRRSMMGKYAMNRLKK